MACLTRAVIFTDCSPDAMVALDILQCKLYRPLYVVGEGTRLQDKAFRLMRMLDIKKPEDIMLGYTSTTQKYKEKGARNEEDARINFKHYQFNVDEPFPGDVYILKPPRELLHAFATDRRRAANIFSQSTLWCHGGSNFTLLARAGDKTTLQHFLSAWKQTFIYDHTVATPNQSILTKSRDEYGVLKKIHEIKGMRDFMRDWDLARMEGYAAYCRSINSAFDEGREALDDGTFSADQIAKYRRYNKAHKHMMKHCGEQCALAVTGMVVMTWDCYQPVRIRFNEDTCEMEAFSVDKSSVYMVKHIGFDLLVARVYYRLL